MARIAGVDLPNNKRVEIGLTYIYGIGLTTAKKIIKETGVDPDFYTSRGFGIDEVLPWDIIDCGVSKQYLLNERKKAYEGITTPSCAEKCNGCGANKLGGKNKWCKQVKPHL